jgi:SecD/SecF fusion protein
MQRNYLRGLLICLVPCLVAALFAVRLDKYRLGIDLAGGTILVYEVNQERTKQRLALQGEAGGQGGQSGGASVDIGKLAHEIKRRIDPTDIKNVTVRPVGSDRVEIIIPFAGAAGGKSAMTAEDVAEVKRLVSQMGVLEFRILANGADDSEGIAQAIAAVNALPADALKALAVEGLPPKGPAGTFSVKIGDTDAQVRYEWAEMGKEERESEGLANRFEGQGGLWKVLADNRGKAVAVARDSDGQWRISDNAGATKVLFSRPVESRDEIAQEVSAAKRAAAGNEQLKPLVEGKSDEEIYQAILTNPELAKAVGPKKVEYFVLTRVSPEDSLKIGEGGATLNATVGQDKNFNLAVDFTFNGAGAQAFGKITRRNKPTGSTTRLLAILLDDKVVSSATIQSEITTQGQITGKFERQYVERLVQILRSGALSAELREKPVSENTIGATLGEDTIRKGTRAVGLAFVAVLVFMVIYYRFAGFVASVALFANLLLTVGFMVAVNAAFTLPGLAGLVLTLGMAVDANVLIYERLREERDKGANLPTAIRNGYDRAFFTIIDTHLTSIFTAIVLYTFGNDQLKGFAIALTVGLVISLFTSLYMTRLMFDYWQHRGWLTNLRMMRIFSRPQVRPMKYRWFFLPFTAALTVAGVWLFWHRGQDVLNVDFRGGTVFAAKLKPGEERALLTVGDKLGYRELLDPKRQRDRLNAVKAEWRNEPPRPERGPDETDEQVQARWEAAVDGLNTFVYTITYGDNTTATVTLSHKPGAAGVYDVQKMEEDVVERARELRDVSVEQTFRSDEPDVGDNKSRHFTIRTTERQPELVRASLDRLFRDEKGNSLLAGPTVKDIKVEGAKATLTFSEPTSRAYVEDLLRRELAKISALAGAEPYKLDAVEASKKDGRYTEMVVDVSKNQTFEKLTSNNPADAEERKKLEASFRGVLDEMKKAVAATPEPERLEVFDSTLAGETRDKAFYAIVVSWIAILLYLWFRFGNWTFGLAAVLCLLHDLCFTLGMIALCHYLVAVPGMTSLGIEDFKIDLAAVAALLTLVGYSVNEIIVNFARVREVRGKNPRLTPEMINDSVSQTLSRTILTSMTVLLVSLVLYIFGGEGVHLFAFVMVIGVLISTYSSIFVASPLLLILGEGRDAGPDTPASTDEPADKEESEEEVLEG